MIRLEDVSKIYRMGENEVRAVDEISLEIREKEMAAIIGQSGSGKTTCMNIIGCLDVPTKGKYFLNRRDVSRLKDDELAEIRNRTLGFIFQQYNLIPKLNVLENVELPLVYKGVHEKDRIRAAQEALEKVGLEDKMNSLPSQLSGGQQQRVSIARALAGRPSIILADEPTGALDTRTGQEILEFLQRLNDEGNTIVLITHDMGVANKAKRIIRLSDGKIVEDTGHSVPAREVTA
ncbi:MAG TPA: ABC transporter ATP-binding protein [Anaerovoracaceae bacterium]|nr:ABC transporter ATP-binding protein [Anaerovoracaceae bacterium]